MNLSATNRRDVLKLFNVSEAARILSWDDQHFRRAIRAGQIQPPTFQLGKRFYFSELELSKLSQKLKQKSHQ